MFHENGYILKLDVFTVLLTELLDTFVNVNEDIILNLESDYFVLIDRIL